MNVILHKSRSYGQRHNFQQFWRLFKELKHADWPTRQSSTALTCTLSVDCPWRLPRTAPHWFFYPYCWWLSARLTQFLHIFDSSMKRTHETNNILVFADKTTNRNCHMVGAQQAIDPPHVLGGNSTSVPPNSHVINSEAWQHVSAADTCALNTTFYDRLLPVRCKSHCRSAVTSDLSMLRFVPVSDTVQHSLIGWLFLVWKRFLAQEIGIANINVMETVCKYHVLLFAERISCHCIAPSVWIRDPAIWSGPGPKYVAYVFIFLSISVFCRL
jgi:hypothetical protein